MKLVVFIFFGLLAFNLFGQIKHPEDDGRIILIPLIFHIVSENRGEEQIINISDEAILKELSELNLNFSAQNDMSILDQSFKNLVGNPNIRFYLADTVLQENVMKGVNEMDDFSGNSLIDPENILNIYIGKIGNSSAVTTNKKLSLRVNINCSIIGNSTNTLTHEIGHWLGLWHIWGHSNCSFLTSIFSIWSDGIEDTPGQFNCTDLSQSKPCPILSKKKRNYNNFMDYNACRCMFTKKQAIAMRNSVINNRKLIFNRSVSELK